jgi:hypothetical protein
MKRKQIFPIQPIDIEKLSTKQLLGRLQRLRECEESLELSDRDATDDTGCIEFKQSQEWLVAFNDVKQILSQREHIPKKSQKP